MLLSLVVCATLSNPQMLIDTSHPMVKDNLSINLPVVIEVSGRISESSAAGFHRNMIMAQKTGQPVIPIVIDSYGGSVYAMFRMVDVIKNSKVPVATIVVGKAMSAAAVLLSCGTEGLRYAAPRSTIMIHEISDSGSGKIKEIEANTEEGKRLNRMLFRLISTNIGKNRGYIKNIVHSKGHADWYLTPKQALEHGLVNHIGIPDISVKAKVEVDLINN